jgi:hypothetical protein
MNMRTKSRPELKLCTKRSIVLEFLDSSAMQLKWQLDPSKSCSFGSYICAMWAWIS